MKYRNWLAGTVCACSIAAAGAAHAGCTDTDRLVGVNLAGAEFNAKKLPGVLHRDYTYPIRDEFAYFASKGATAIRLPFRWERIQRTLMGPLDDSEVKAMAAAIAAAGEFDLCVILDAHNYGAYRGEAVGSAMVPGAALTDLWVRLAQRFPDESRVALGLMNEPKALIISDWVKHAQNTVNGLRQAGSRHLVLVSGGRWSGVHEWSKVFSGTSNAQAFADFHDPGGRMAIDVHQYVDANFSGTTTACLLPDRFDNMFRIIGEWAREYGHKLFLGEFGTPGTPDCLATLDRLLALTNDSSAWLGWTYWAGGRWWGAYPLNVSPDKNGNDASQMTVLQRYLVQ